MVGSVIKCFQLESQHSNGFVSLNWELNQEFLALSYTSSSKNIVFTVTKGMICLRLRMLKSGR